MKLDGSFELKTLAGQSIVVPGKLKNVDSGFMMKKTKKKLHLHVV